LEIGGVGGGNVTAAPSGAVFHTRLPDFFPGLALRRENICLSLNSLHPA